MAFYIDILKMQSPFPSGVDTSAEKRVVYSVNFYIKSTSSTLPKLGHEIVKLLSDADLIISSGATRNTYIGLLATLPAGPGPIIQIIPTGGTTPIYTHDGKQIDRPSLQIMVRATNPDIAEDKINRICDFLDGKRNVEVTL